MGIPVFASSILLLQQNSFIGAVLTIIVGNAIMWFIRLGILSMSNKHRQSTLDISREYLGNFGGYFISILLLISAFAWYVAQTSIAGNSLTHLLSIRENQSINQFAQMSILLGILSAFLCMEGMVLLKKLSIGAFPILVVTLFIILFTLPSRSVNTQIEAISLSGLSLFLATNLGLSSDLPTFFRHGQSWATAIKALTIIQVLNIVFGILGLYFGDLVINSLAINETMVLSTANDFLRYSLVIFIFVSVLCANVANVYSASVGWEIVAPKSLVGRKEYLILGLGLAILFILISDVFPVDFLLNITDSALVNLCLILTVGNIITRRIKEPPTVHLQRTLFIAWFGSTGINIVQFFYPSHLSPLALSFITILIIVGIGLVWLRKSKRH
jgi:purine-cytosine permease-like protein